VSVCWHAQRARREPQAVDRVAEGACVAEIVKAAQVLLLRPRIEFVRDYWRLVGFWQVLTGCWLIDLTYGTVSDAARNRHWWG